MKIVQDPMGWRLTDKDGCNEVFDTKKEARRWYRKYGPSANKYAFGLSVLKAIGVVCAVPVVAFLGLMIFGLLSSAPKPKRVWLVEEV